MAARSTKKTNDTKDFVPMERTRALLNQLWDHWRVTLGHTPDMAKRMMTAAIQEMHKTEKQIHKAGTADIKKIGAKKTAVKNAVKKSVKKAVVKKIDAAKRKIK